MIVSGSCDKTIKIWDSNSGGLLKTFEGHTDNVTSVNFTTDGKKILSSSKDKTVKLWDSETGKQEINMIGHKAEVKDAKFSPSE